MEMHYLCFLIASVFSWTVSAQTPPIERIITDYFKSQSVQSFRTAWGIHKQAMEHAIKTALSETVGLPGMNVYVRKVKEKLAVANYQGEIGGIGMSRLFVKDVNLKSMPRCRLPDLHFSLASNVLKIQTKLSKIIIHANYTNIRNRYDIVYETKHQNAYENSPYMFVQVEDSGSIAIRADDCTLSGFIIATLGGDSVNLGYNYFKLSECLYTAEIFKAGRNSPPVFHKYASRNKDYEFSVAALTLQPLLTEELIPKMQAAVYSFINSSAIFGSLYTEYRDNQEILFQTTAQYMTDLIRNLNRITVEKNKDIIYIQDNTLLWDDVKLEEVLKLTDMVLFGLNSMYSAHSGGPFKTDKVRIAEEIRFSSLQVRGTLKVTSNGTDQSFGFATEIIDLVLDVHLEEGNWGEVSLRVKELRRMTFSLSNITQTPVEDYIRAYLLKTVPNLIYDYLTDIFPEAVRLSKI